jgi:putative ABC transport system substrate-binding protein
MFRDALQEVGYVDGKTIVIEHRWTEGRADRAIALAEELVRLNVDVIVANGTPAVSPAREATATIPIVALSADLLGTGYVATLARPGGNVTGVSVGQVDLSGKELDLLREALPRLRRVAYLASSTDPNGPRFVDHTRAAADRIGVQVQPFFVRRAADLDGTLSAIVKAQPDALIVQPIFLAEHSRRIADVATRYRLPTLSYAARFAEEGGMMTYGASSRGNYRLVGRYVDRILKGAKPSELPVQQPTTFELVINGKTAKAIGVTMPPALLLRADRVLD